MSADWVVQSPGLSQSLNRYSYVWNNPINGTDPTGNIGDFRVGESLGLDGGNYQSLTDYARPYIDSFKTFLGNGSAERFDYALSETFKGVETAFIIQSGIELFSLGKAAINVGLSRFSSAGSTRLLANEVGSVGIRSFPLGFKNLKQFQSSANQFKLASGVDDIVVGVRGSASTGQKFSGGRFNQSSDIDFFAVSDKLFNSAINAGAQSSNGALRVGATPKFFPNLHSVENALTNNLGRKTSIRVFSKQGFEAIKTGTEIFAK